ncbi:MAG: hypothetical protein KF708_14960 [Pirellulales bacterium]|nr:hypothetical protein [Pirellulales bacterium]
MRARLALLLMLTLAATGCRTHLSLRDNTLQTTATLADLNYQQVLDNLARFESNPAAMPSIAIVNAGTVNVADQKGFQGSATYAPTLQAAQQMGAGLPILSLLFSPNTSRNITENWSLAPVTDIDNLRRIRCAFQLVVMQGGQISDCIPCRNLIERFYLGEQDRLECILPLGWYGVGCQEEVPCDACYVGNCGDTFVWVTPDGMDGLSLFTMTVIDLATGKPHAPTKNVVRTYKADGTLDSVQVTTTEIDNETLEQMKQDENFTERPRLYVDPPAVNPGMFFVPR